MSRAGVDPHGRVLPDPARRALLGWGEVHRRELPWRRTRDPWAILVSEVMLQQTQVARVRDRWQVFLERFPTVRACASAPVAAVIGQWAGLGYNRRAVNLHRAAVACVERHDGQLPDDLAALLALPGVGPYTARAVLAFAFARDHAAVDTNVGRVLARVAGEPLSAGRAQAVADAAVPAGEGWSWNQTLLDLGATVCTGRAPRCGRCPLASWCRWCGGELPRTATDPAARSAARGGRQSRFKGSDRQGRGRLVALLREGRAIPPGDLARLAGWPGEGVRARRVAQGLVDDGLASWDRAGQLVAPR